MPKPQSHPKPLATPRIPVEAPQLAEQSRDRGRNYLAGRGISRQTLEAAEKAGFLKYLIDGILFIGRDLLDIVRSVTKRATDPGAEVQKRDFAGTDKSFPSILRGGKTVWIVEGGVDALAAHDLATGAGSPPLFVGVPPGLDDHHKQVLPDRFRRCFRRNAVRSYRIPIAPPSCKLLAGSCSSQNFGGLRPFSNWIKSSPFPRISDTVAIREKCSAWLMHFGLNVDAPHLVCWLPTVRQK